MKIEMVMDQPYEINEETKKWIENELRIFLKTHLEVEIINSINIELD